MHNIQRNYVQDERMYFVSFPYFSSAKKQPDKKDTKYNKWLLVHKIIKYRDNKIKNTQLKNKDLCTGRYRYKRKVHRRRGTGRGMTQTCAESILLNSAEKEIRHSEFLSSTNQ